MNPTGNPEFEEGTPLRQYEVGVVYKFWAEDEEHAVEQFADAEPAVADSVNYIEELPAF